eukprot:m51a1_g6999 hypothetical protein (250) ;mRNA; r:198833-199735
MFSGRTFGTLRTETSWSSVFKTHDLATWPACTRSSRWCVLAAAAGAVANAYVALPATLCSLSSLGLVVALGFARPPLSDADPDTTRVSLLLAFGALTGAGLTPFLAAVAGVDPVLVPLGLAGALAVFACFSVSALLSPRRSALYLGGVLGTALVGLVLVGLANVFVRSAALYAVQLYGGLVVFSFFVAFDTQLMIERADAGSCDAVRSALELFLDFVNIAVRIWQILAKSKKEGDSGSGSGSRSRTSRR